MVWYGMEWNGMEWNGMVWYGMVWYSIAWPSSGSRLGLSQLLGLPYSLWCLDETLNISEGFRSQPSDGPIFLI